MAARIEVVNGPDAGWRYRMANREIRIGRGAGNQVNLTDASWGPGHLKVEFQKGGYVVQNHMPHAIYLDGKPLSESETRTWYTGSKLQPTRNTVLVLTVVDNPIEESPSTQKTTNEDPLKVKNEQPKSQTGQYIAIVAIAMAMGFLAFRGDSQPSSLSVDARHAKVNIALDTVSPSNPAFDHVRRIKKKIADGVFRESSDTPYSAKELYLEARNLIPTAARAGAPESSLADAEAFVLDRLQALPSPPK